MLAKNHLVGGVATATPVILTVYGLSRWNGSELIGEQAGHIVQTSASALCGWAVHGAWWFPIAAVACFLLGTLLPDIDNPRSKLGRYVPFLSKLNVVHRGFTHSDWFTVLLLLVSLISELRFMFWLALGVQTHLELDGASRAGRARYYPLRSNTWKIIRLDDGVRTVVLKSWFFGHWHGFYKSDKKSEKIFFRIVICLSILISALLLRWIVFFM